MVTRWRRSGPRLSARHLQALEGAVGVLPPAYRKWLQKHNGGIPSPCYFPYFDRRRRLYSWVETMLQAAAGGAPDAAYDIVANHGAMGSRLPRGCLVIGYAVRDDVLGLRLAGRKIGEVVLWSAEQDKVFRVAPDFGSFLASLCSDPGDELL